MSQTETEKSTTRDEEAIWYFSWGLHRTLATGAMVWMQYSRVALWLDSMSQTLIILSLPAVDSHFFSRGCQSTENTGPLWAVNCLSGRLKFLKSHNWTFPFSWTDAMEYMAYGENCKSLTDSERESKVETAWPCLKSNNFIVPSWEHETSRFTSDGWKQTVLTVLRWSWKMPSIFDLPDFPKFQMTTAPLVAPVASNDSSTAFQATSLLLKFKLRFFPDRRFAFSIKLLFSMSIS